MSIIIHNLQKTYKQKKKPDVKALQGISFTMPEKGMVFILGKSGCGKSTLLNVLGGLDGFDGGDVVIDGKSLKNFSPKELDNYRNKNVGFVFQENNLFNEYSVESNVGLALYLQKTTSERQLNDVLKSVGLEDFSDRKCNCLSGGQKQRVAIARAIIKNPKILLCDEPTGSLDSETGADIFNLLKEISKDKLVVVVSHDGESAEKYGDRVIEMKDGKIISDSAPLLEQEASMPSEAKPEKHGMLIKQIFKLGAGFLIARPVRLAFCILICLITVTFVGVADTFASYDKSKAIVQTMDLYQTSYLSFAKKCFKYNDDVKQWSYSSMGFSMNEEDVSALQTYVDCSRLDKLYDLKMNMNIYVDSHNSILQLGKKYKTEETFGVKTYSVVDNLFIFINGFMELDEAFAEDYGYDVYGEYPKAYDEAVITENIFNAFKNYGYLEEEIDNVLNEDEYEEAVGKIQAVNSYDDIIGKTITINETSFKIVGVINTKINEDLYGGLLNGDNDDDGNFSGLYELMSYGLHNAIYLAPGYYQNVYLPAAIEKSENIYSANNIPSIITITAPAPESYSEMLSYVNLSNTILSNLPEDYDYESYFYTYTLTNDAVYVVNDIDYEMSLIKLIGFYIALGTIVISVMFLFVFQCGRSKREEARNRNIACARSFACRSV